jgi:hypothetical protein
MGLGLLSIIIPMIEMLLTDDLERIAAGAGRLMINLG